MQKKKKISIFGSTGSIGRSTLSVIEANSDLFEIAYLSTNKSFDLIIEQAKKFIPKGVIATDRENYDRLKKSGELDVPLYNSDDLAIIAAQEDFDILVAAMVGFSGLESTIAAINSGKNIALANKETLVVAGHLITKLVAEKKVSLLPIDSEHSAIFQCLLGEDIKNVKNLILTASGGPFLHKELKDFNRITVTEALKHPNWSMGKKITIDSATMMNKGLEIIEAYWLFGIEKDKIKVLIHPQSIIHSMVEFVDGSIKAQLGIPDMKLPIQFALSYPQRFKYNHSPMDFLKYNTLNFFEPDLDKFKCLDLAIKSMHLGGSYPVAMNAANEIAVEKFLSEQISFSRIPLIIEQAISRDLSQKKPNINEILICDRETRDFCRRLN